eukprot:GHVP01024335.1.p1 GENE.GHVP01024335.1~~GHVP01024335.1.p1  ORF type:complete len:202 (+),score=35.75 GHVP01024335.1:2-607(+)
MEENIEKLERLYINDILKKDGMAGIRVGSRFKGSQNNGRKHTLDLDLYIREIDRERETFHGYIDAKKHLAKENLVKTFFRAEFIGNINETRVTRWGITSGCEYANWKRIFPNSYKKLLKGYDGFDLDKEKVSYIRLKEFKCVGYNQSSSKEISFSGSYYLRFDFDTKKITGEYVSDFSNRTEHLEMKKVPEQRQSGHFQRY